MLAREGEKKQLQTNKESKTQLGVAEFEILGRNHQIIVGTNELCQKNTGEFHRIIQVGIDPVW